MRTSARPSGDSEQGKSAFKRAQVCRLANVNYLGGAEERASGRQFPRSLSLTGSLNQSEASATWFQSLKM